MIFTDPRNAETLISIKILICLLLISNGYCSSFENSPGRRKPDWLLVGASKSGTSAFITVASITREFRPSKHSKLLHPKMCVHPVIILRNLSLSKQHIRSTFDAHPFESALQCNLREFKTVRGMSPVLVDLDQT